MAIGAFSYVCAIRILEGVIEREMSRQWYSVAKDRQVIIISTAHDNIPKPKVNNLVICLLMVHCRQVCQKGQ